MVFCSLCYPNITGIPSWGSDSVLKLPEINLLVAAAGSDDGLGGMESGLINGTVVPRKLVQDPP